MGEDQVVILWLRQLSAKSGLIKQKQMLHHLSIAVSDLDRGSAFYDAVLRSLGYTQVYADDEAVAMV
ncbi:hypothetical protein ACWV27_14960 [Massilia varians]